MAYEIDCLCCQQDYDDREYLEDYDEEEEFIQEVDCSSSESSTPEEIFSAENQKSLRKATNNIDRAREDKLVAEYKETGNEDIINELYEMRKGTLAYWANRYSYLADNPEDLFGDLRGVWSKCILNYEYNPKERVVKTKKGKLVKDKKGKVKKRVKRTAFNTFLYSSLLYYIRNLIKKHYSKKRTDENGNPYAFNMMSMDQDLSNEGDSFTLHDIVPSRNLANNSSNMSSDEIIDHIAEGDEDIRRALRLLAYDPNIKKISVAARMKHGELSISSADVKRYCRGSKTAIKEVKRKINQKEKLNNRFNLVSYQVFPGKIKYEILCNDMKLFNKIIKRIRSKEGTLRKFC